MRGAARAEGEDVVALAVDGDAELDGGDGPLLADELEAVLEVVGGGEVDVRQRARRVQRFGRQGRYGSHVEVLSMGAARAARVGGPGHCIAAGSAAAETRGAPAHDVLPERRLERLS